MRKFIIISNETHSGLQPLLCCASDPEMTEEKVLSFMRAREASRYQVYEVTPRQIKEVIRKEIV